jgi:acyl carrier protein
MHQTVMDVVAKHFKVDPGTLTLDTRLREDLGGDSLDLVELVFDLEQALGVTVRDGTIGDVRTVGDAVRHLQSSS